jgi:hypothetical protein
MGPPVEVSDAECGRALSRWLPVVGVQRGVKVELPQPRSGEDKRP